MMTFIAAIIEPNLKFFYLKFNKKRLGWIKTYRLDHGVIENPSFEPLFVTSDQWFVWMPALLMQASAVRFIQTTLSYLVWVPTSKLLSLDSF